LQVALRRKQAACAAVTDKLHEILTTEDEDELLDLMDQSVRGGAGVRWAGRPFRHAFCS
jgi:hypothetical protein